MFHWEPEGRYKCHRLCTAIAPFWSLNSDNALLALKWRYHNPVFVIHMQKFLLVLFSIHHLKAKCNENCWKVSNYSWFIALFHNSFPRNSVWRDDKWELELCLDELNEQEPCFQVACNVLEIQNSIQLALGYPDISTIRPRSCSVYCSLFIYMCFHQKSCSKQSG